MPLFVLYGLDGPNGAEIRRTTRRSHLDWIGQQAPRVKAAGPMYAEDGATPVGSMFILEADSLTHARTMCAEDPYAKANLWARCDIRQFNWIVRQ
jgi:uncharacterized protein YciI